MNEEPSRVVAGRHGRLMRWGPAILALSASAVAWTVLVVLFPPRQQNFPLMDDWSFSRGVLRFAKHGEISYGGELSYGGSAAMPQLGQWLFALPFLLLRGPVHVLLRLSTLVISGIGLAAYYDLVASRGLGPGRAGLVTATLAFNPYFFLLQGTFMSDVPALSLALAALALYQRGLRNRSPVLFLGGGLLGILAGATRQNAAALFFAAGIMLAAHPWRRRMRAWLSIVGPLSAVIGIGIWFSLRSDTWKKTPELPDVSRAFFLLFAIPHALGIFAAPLLSVAGALRSAIFWILAVGLGGAAYFWASHPFEVGYGSWFPYLGNTLGPEGYWSDASFYLGQRPVLLGPVLRLPLTVFGCLAGASLGMSAARALRQGAWRNPLVIFSAAQLVVVFFSPLFNDRYLLFFLPGTLALAGQVNLSANPHRLTRLVTLGVLAFFSVALTHDYFAWNCSRWSLGRRAVVRGVGTSEIEGGLEWNGWFALRDSSSGHERVNAGLALPFTRFAFPHVSGRYGISFSVLPGTRIVDSQSYTLWLSPGPHRLYLLEAS
jgi:hypothetical protein